MKKFKQIFPSRNYITVDTFGETEVIFNPVGDGFEGDDKLIFRKGRWAFRVNDFLAGKTLPNGENEKMNRKVYSLGIVWDSADNEPLINTTYVDPTSVIPLDGSLVEISNTDYAKESTLVSVGGHLSAINTSLTTLFDVPLSTRASEESVVLTKDFVKRVFYNNLLLRIDINIDKSSSSSFEFRGFSSMFSIGSPSPRINSHVHNFTAFVKGYFRHNDNVQQQTWKSSEFFIEINDKYNRLSVYCIDNGVARSIENYTYTSMSGGAHLVDNSFMIDETEI